MSILFKEEDSAYFISVLENQVDLVMSSATLAECGIVAERKKGVRGVEILNGLITASGIQIEPFTHEQATIAVNAFKGFGGALNFGDALSYALAKDKDIPLLFKGDDFSRTDVAIFNLV